VPRRALSFFSRSVLGRLILLITAVLIPATGLVSWLIYEGYWNERRTLERHLVSSVGSTALLVDAVLSERQALLEGLVTSSRLQSGDLVGFREQAKAALSSTDEWIVLIDPNGQQVVNTRIPPDAPLPKVPFRPEFREAAEKGRSYISNLILGPVAQRHLIFTAIPIRQDGKLIYTLNCAMTPAVFAHALEQGSVGHAWTVAIIDRNKVVTARNRRPEEYVGVAATPSLVAALDAKPSGITESITLDGIKSITAFTRSNKSGWSVVIGAPAAELYASAERLLLVAGGVSLLLGALAVMVALWVARGVVSAVRRLVMETEAIGRGEVLAPAGETGMQETDFVFNALSESSARLSARESELRRLNETLTAAAQSLREKQERLDAARTAAATGTFVWHAETNNFESDESLNALCALPEERALRSLTQFLDIVHFDDRERVHNALVASAQTGMDLAVEFRIIRPDWAARWLFCRGRVVRGGDRGGNYIAAACVDVTERKTAEAEIARARDAAVAAGRAKDEFIAALSHELRTPLNPVLLVASDAATREEYPPAAREAFASIAKNARLEARLIDDLLDLTRIAQGKLSLDLEVLDLNGVLHEAIEKVRPELEEKHQTLRWQRDPLPIRVSGDPTRLQQVFWNVLKNAVKFTGDRGSITVSARRKDGWVEIDVADSGIGMTPEEIARGFRMFSQGDHAAYAGAHRFGGLGLGLAISRTLLELHGGKISASSPGRGAGSTFTIQLRLEERPAAAEIKSVETNPPLETAPKGARILLVEDHEPTRLAVQRLLKRRGFAVIAAGTAEEALRAAEKEEIDLVISDIGLPDFDGFSLMTRLRDSHALRGIALTGYGMEEDIERSRAAGFVAHLIKPIDVHKLEAALAQALRP
jgi:signal transduction histidine kinase/CheY-like chemotaxis protein